MFRLSFLSQCQVCVSVLCFLTSTKVEGWGEKKQLLSVNYKIHSWEDNMCWLLSYSTFAHIRPGTVLACFTQVKRTSGLVCLSSSYHNWTIDGWKDRWNILVKIADILYKKERLERNTDYWHNNNVAWRVTLIFSTLTCNSNRLLLDRACSEFHHSPHMLSIAVQ